MYIKTHGAESKMQPSLKNKNRGVGCLLTEITITRSKVKLNAWGMELLY